MQQIDALKRDIAELREHEHAACLRAAHICHSRIEARVLVVDDSTAIQRLFRLVFSEELDLVTASTLEEAQAAIADEMPDLIVTDSFATEFVREVCTRAGVPMLIHSGSNVFELREIGRKMGAPYLQKPASVEEIRQAVTELLATG